MSTRKLPDRFLYGGDYNPEQWPESVWPEDVRLMREAGVNTVSLAIFSWAKLEPRPGVYDFAWLDRVIALLRENNIDILLATATAAPPPWFSKLHPESKPVTYAGQTLEVGSRQLYSPSSAAYQKAAVNLADQIAARYAHHPAVIGWHINNEYCCHVPLSYDDETAAAFRLWLRQRYQTIEQLNAAWGTAFWSQQYSEWDEIMPPRPSPTFINPCQHLDFRRFSSDALLNICRAEIAAVRRHNPALPVTTNFMGIHVAGVDQFEWAKHLDYTAWDSYPNQFPALAENETAGNAASHDLTRGAGAGKPFLLMEQAPSAINWGAINPQKQPGVMRTYSWQAVARGANAVMFFQWRASRAGAEKFLSGIVPHGGTAHSRTWREVCHLGAELAAAKELLDTRFTAATAILCDWNIRWAADLDSKPRAAMRYIPNLLRQYNSLYDLNIPVDFIPLTGDFAKYRLVILPMAYLLDAATADRLRQYVNNGGHLLVTWFSGIVDETETVQLGGYPALLRDVLGITVDEWQPLPDGTNNSIRYPDGRTATCDFWTEALRATGAEPVATYQADYFAGQPAITRHQYGAGTAWYLSTRLTPAANTDLLRAITAAAAVTPVLTTPPGVEAVIRGAPDRRYLFLINHTPATHTVNLDRHRGADILDHHTPHQDRLTLPPRAVKILRLT